MDCWKLSIGQIEDNQISPVEHLPAGHTLDWPAWRTLNRLRTRVGRSKDNLKCTCGDEYTMRYLLICPNCSTNRTTMDHKTVTKDATKIVKHRKEKI
jgi:hypothetical protein